MRTIVMGSPGGPEVLHLAETAIADPGPGQVRLTQTVVGVNFIDIQHRTGRYPLAAYPAVIGVEAAGVVEALGAGVNERKIGERVAYLSNIAGAYAEQRLVPAERIIALPDSIDDFVAGANLLRGLTAQYLVDGAYRVKPGDRVLVHAAAGGVGLILCQWARHLGATVIGTVGSAGKAALALSHGCDHVIDYVVEDFAARIREITAGRGVDVVYDAIGATTFERSLACLKPRGMMVTYGTAAGPIAAFDPSRLNQLGSLYLTSPSVFSYTQNRSELIDRAAAFFNVVRKGIVRVSTPHRYALADAARAHADLQERRTTGGVALVT